MLHAARCTLDVACCEGLRIVQVTCEGMFGPWQQFATLPYLDVTLSIPPNSIYSLEDRCKTCYDLAPVE